MYLARFCRRRPYITRYHTTNQQQKQINIFKKFDYMQLEKVSNLFKGMSLPVCLLLKMVTATEEYLEFFRYFLFW